MRRACTKNIVTSPRQSTASKQRYRSRWHDGIRKRVPLWNSLPDAKDFHSVIVRDTNDFWYTVVLQHGTRNLCCVTVPLTVLSFNTRSSLSGGIATCSLRILYRKASVLTHLRSSKGSSFSSCNIVTLVDWSHVLVIQRFMFHSRRQTEMKMF